MIYEELIIAGFGGQGVILSGKLVAQAAMRQGLEVTYFPSYGPEVRGGTANCMIVISDKPVPSPLITRPTAAVVLNQASHDRFAPLVRPGGLLVSNRNLVTKKLDRGDLDCAEVPADTLALQIGNARCANMVMLGAYLQKRPYLPLDLLCDCLKDVLAERYHNTIPLNIQALQAGAKAVEKANYQTSK